MASEREGRQPIDPDRAEVTRILDALARGEGLAGRDLLPLVYDEMRRLATHRLANETPGQTLQPTALVHQAYLRVVGPDSGVPWSGRGHFFAAAAEAMRRILIDRARDRKRLKRGGGRRREALDLDALVDKDRTRRYETATSFAQDIQRYLDGDAVEASPPFGVLQAEEVRPQAPGGPGDGRSLRRPANDRDGHHRRARLLGQPRADPRRGGREVRRSAARASQRAREDGHRRGEAVRRGD